MITLASFLLAPRPCIVVASNGRSGSTLTYAALRKARNRRFWWKKQGFPFDARLKDAPLEPGTVTKTHDFPDALRGRDNVKVVFCFGSARDSALSVYSAMERYGPDWIADHFYHLHAKGGFDDLFRYDVLRQAEQVRAWATFEDVPVLCVHYDAIWRRQKDIAEFTGLNFTPPERKERAPKQIPQDLLRAASEVYDPIDAVLAELPEMFLSSKEMAGAVSKLPV
ncbi:hypothetical protein AVO45_13080 [Ruegeria marisrubri]|uniref:Sulfotransferase domain-containing protein n=1 Tax=Ruegeria marisrubri TaxID=1685379 RepID=A0A0X3TKD3_9RHOB|nr:hypothetical protein [Ruegeria marisrubri]KUJ76237.1 hypothetical protein AVO45_13080 [Ruegeria marisrubri]